MIILLDQLIFVVVPTIFRMFIFRSNGNIAISIKYAIVNGSSLVFFATYNYRVILLFISKKYLVSIMY